MAEAKQVAQYNSFVAGLITEATELTYPPNSSSDEDNCVLFTKGNRRRRLGIDFEDDYIRAATPVTDADLETFAISTHEWFAVSGVGTLNFSVIQLGNTLHFYDSSEESLSAGKKSFTVDLDSYLAPAATTAALDIVSSTTGRGDFFVVSPAIEPFRVSYDVDLNTITVIPIEIRVRDFEGVDDGLAIDEEPPTLTALHKYNLYNQGWYPTPSGKDNLDIYFTESALYPSNNIQWHLAVKTFGARPPNPPGGTYNANQQGEVDSYALRKLSIGTTAAPKGHFILDPFYKDRSGVSGIVGLTVESTNERPTAIKGYSGRICYSLKSDVYISELLNQDRDNAGKCYQDADPTSEDISDLIDTDGVVISIPEAGNILKMDVVGNALVVFANNGVWSISGTDGGFKATDFQINKITGAGILSRTALVNAEGTIVWWSDTGIFTLQQDKVSGLPTAVSMSDQTIKTFYNEIDAVARANAVGRYDSATQTITWAYKDADDAPDASSPYYFNRLLNLNLGLGAFYPGSIGQMENDMEVPVEAPFIAGMVVTPTLNQIIEELQVVDSSGNEVVTSTGDFVTYGASRAAGQSTFIKYLTIVPDVTDDTNDITFSLFKNKSLTDWETYAIMDQLLDEGVNYSSYIETGHDLQGDITRFKQAPYVITHLKRTETGYDVETEEWENPSGCLLRGKWDWTNSGDSGKWSVNQQIYRIRNRDIPTVSTVEYNRGNNVITSRTRIRGRGRALQLKFESEQGKDFDILGWGIIYVGNSEV